MPAWEAKPRRESGSAGMAPRKKALTSHLPLKVVAQLGDLLCVFLQKWKPAVTRRQTEKPLGKPSAILAGPCAPDAHTTSRTIWFWYLPHFKTHLAQVSSEPEKMFSEILRTDSSRRPLAGLPAGGAMATPSGPAGSPRGLPHPPLWLRATVRTFSNRQLLYQF